MHRDNLEVPVADFIDAMNAEQTQGRIGLIGVSNWELQRILEANAYAAANGKTGIQAISNNFSLAQMVNPIWPGVESAANPEFADFLHESQTPLLPWSAQARGFFTPWADEVRQAQASARGAITTMEPTADELRYTWFSDENFERRARAQEIANEKGVPLINVALAYVAQQAFPCHPLIGARSLAEIDSCIQGAQLDIAPGDISWLANGGSRAH